MNRSKLHVVRCLSILALACALTISLYPSRASAEESGRTPEKVSGDAGLLPDSRDTADGSETVDDRSREEETANTKQQEEPKVKAPDKETEDEIQDQIEENTGQEKETQNAQQADDEVNTAPGENGESAVQGSGTDHTGSSEGAADIGYDKIGFSQTDPATGISAEAEAGVFPLGTVMAVTPIESGENYEQLAGFLSAAADQFWICDISFFTVSLPDMSVITPVSPQGTVKIRMPIPAGYDISRLGLYHIGTDGTIDETAFAAEGGKIVFETDQFSLYAVVEKKEIKTDLPASLEMTDKVSHLELTKEYRGGSTSISVGSEYSNPQTGDQTGLPAMAVQAATALGTAAAAAGLRRYKQLGKNRA